MNWLHSIIIGFISAVLGTILAWCVASACVSWHRISGFEGGSGYFVIFNTLFGGIIAFAVGFLVSLVVSFVSSPGFLKGLGFSSLSVLVIAGLVGLVAWWTADISPRMNERSLELAIEVRGPKDFTVPTEVEKPAAFACVYLPRGRHQPNGELRLKEARLVDGRWVVSATVPLDTSSTKKYLRAYFNKDTDVMFWLPLRAHPRSSDLGWSQWVESAWDAGKPEPPPEGKFKLRYRVQLVEPPPPGPTVEEIAARDAAEAQAKFDALGAQTPIQEWFPHTRYGAAEDRRAIAIRHIIARTNYVAELSALMIGSDDDAAKEAIYLIEHLPRPSAVFLEPVAIAGRHLADLIRRVNATTVEQDPSYLGAASVAVRFSAWMVAARTLRKESGGDFTPELRVILELSRVRRDSQVMRGDVCRVASYYMQQWAGLAPLPTDPPPK